ncbi:hypothetical protein SMICM304S_04374 [Streptomyces microflavus]
MPGLAPQCFTSVTVSAGCRGFLLVLAPLLVWYVQPQAKRTPIDIDTTTVFTGTGSYFDTSKVETVEGKEITITRQVRGDVADSLKSGNAIWDVSTSVDHSETWPSLRPRRPPVTLERWVTDRTTNEPVHCCEDSPTFDGEAYLKFPFDVEDVLTAGGMYLGGVVRLEYAGKKKVQGYEGVRVQGHGRADPDRGAAGARRAGGQARYAPDPRRASGDPNSGIELVGGRRTGRIMNAAIGPKKTLRAPGSSKDAVTLLESERVEFTKETQLKQVELASADSDRLALLSGTLPAGAVGLGLVLATLGIVLVVRGRRTQPEASNTHIMTNLPT